MNADPRAIHSMTGFGLGTAEGDGHAVRVEIRAVNHRGRKLNVRSRPSLGPLEQKLRDRVAQTLARGAIDVYLSLARTPGDGAPPIDEDLGRGLVLAVRRLARSLDLGDGLDARDLLQVPGLFADLSDEPVAEAEWPLVETALAHALAQVARMRAAEGEATAASLKRLAEPIAAFVDFAGAQAPQVVERARARLQARLAELAPEGLRPADEQALEREVCLFADRADIHEEMDRLRSHLEQYRALLDRGGEIGKRLEFLAQEFLREVNTTASKANDTAIVTRAIDAKLAVEKIKEQAANIE